jgi:NADP-dependent 3-hydroxy acid dehydrogenase YdfG
MAESLTQSGYTVVATARHIEDIQNLNTALKLPLDVTDNQSITDAVDQIISQFGKIDILINNAGYATRCAVEEISDEDIEQIFNVNVYGALRMIRAVVPHMRKQKSGRIINISSIAAKTAIPFSGAYCASKSALEALSDTLRMELSAFEISVVVIEPGNIRTEFIKKVHNNSQKNMSNPKSPYYEFYKNYRTFNDKSRAKESSPEVVTVVIRKAIETSKPRARYYVAVPIANRLLSYLGDRMRDRIIKFAFKIK